jgi:dCTP diphosphatase
MTDLKSLTKKVVEFCNKRGWKKSRTAKNQAIALVVEAVEFLEVFNYSLSSDIPKGKRKHFEEELMDVLFWILLIAHDNNVDIPKAFLRKMKKNKNKYPLK